MNVDEDPLTENLRSKGVDRRGRMKIDRSKERNGKFFEGPCAWPGSFNSREVAQPC
jgi:hypothetical protein